MSLVRFITTNLRDWLREELLQEKRQRKGEGKDRRFKLGCKLRRMFVAVLHVFPKQLNWLP